MTSVRKHTVFLPCTRHADMYARETRQRRAEVMTEGGWNVSPCADGEACKLKPGTDLFTSKFVESDPTYVVRLEYLRGQLRAECISYAELAELQGLAGHIGAGDVELLEAAGVPEELAHLSPAEREAGMSYKQAADILNAAQDEHDARVGA